MSVPILKQGPYLIATVQAALTDAELAELQEQLSERVGRFRSTGVVIDVGAVDVLDSFATRMLRDIARVLHLRGAETVIVGINPEVAFAMVRMGLGLEDVATALDLEEALELLRRRDGGRRER
ncbi:MAG TPA: STAS domain-containing protein [Actinomycetota bacterium]|nr:STAS domain-containing protein [Actinomycetota bacterium]